MNARSYGRGAPEPGKLLVASPAMTDENFVDAVVLVVDMDENGALGVVINRPTPVLVAAVLGEWSEFAAEPEVLFRGGPVGTDGALALALLRNVDDAVPEGFNAIVGAVGLLDLETPMELLGSSVVAVRLFAGYAGWGPGQLEEEIASGDWDVVPAHSDDVFRSDPEGLRRAVLRRQPGELAWRSTRPADPDLN